MGREVKIAEFKTRLSEYLRDVRNGQELIIKDRQTPIARVLPYSPLNKRLQTIGATVSLKQIDQLPFFRPKKIKRKDLDQALRWARRERF